MKSFQQILEMAKSRDQKKIAVACAQDKDVLLAVNEAKKLGIVSAVLVGDKNAIEEILIGNAINPLDYEIVDVKDNVEAANTAARLVSEKKADILMKGLVDTSIILKAVLNKELNLRTGKPISHVAVFEIPGYDRLIFVTDPAMNIAPDVKTKGAIIENCAMLAHSLDLENPIVGVLAAKEKIDEKMPATVDAGILVEMNKNGEIRGCRVGGPYALDNAVSVEAAHHKGMTDPLAGKCDILLVPDIEAGNILYKSIAYFSEAKLAGIILGASTPIVLTSRADSEVTKMHSIALAVLYANKY